LCAFEEGAATPILPAEYGPKLRGAIVEACFTLSHKIINCQNGLTSHFVATIDELIILGMPMEVSLSPSKMKHKKLFCNPNPKPNPKLNPKHKEPSSEHCAPCVGGNSAHWV
jgi:hypothetical protein